MFSVGVSIASQSKVRLPCPARDLLEVCRLDMVVPGVSGTSNRLPHLDSKTGGLPPSQFWGWGRLLRTSPALFLLAASRFYQQYGKSPESSARLILWSAGNLADALLAKMIFERSIDGGCKLNRRRR